MIGNLATWFFTRQFRFACLWSRTVSVSIASLRCLPVTFSIDLPTSWSGSSLHSSFRPCLLSFQDCIASAQKLTYSFAAPCYFSLSARTADHAHWERKTLGYSSCFALASGASASAFHLLGPDSQSGTSSPHFRNDGGNCYCPKLGAASPADTRCWSYGPERPGTSASYGTSSATYPTEHEPDPYRHHLSPLRWRARWDDVTKRFRQFPTSSPRA